MLNARRHRYASLLRPLCAAAWVAFTIWSLVSSAQTYLLIVVGPLMLGLLVPIVLHALAALRASPRHPLKPTDGQDPARTDPDGA